MADQMQVSTMEEQSSATVHSVFVGGVSPVKTGIDHNVKPYFSSTVIYAVYLPWHGP